MGSLGLARALLLRPFALQRGGGGLRLVFVERRHAVADGMGLPMDSLGDALQAWLVGHGQETAVLVMRHLLVVHDSLCRSGWPAVERLPSVLLGKAVGQGELLSSGVPVPTKCLTDLIDRLRAAKVVAELREESVQSAMPTLLSDLVTVTEVTHEEFEAVERHWRLTRAAPKGVSACAE